MDILPKSGQHLLPTKRCTHYPIKICDSYENAVLICCSKKGSKTTLGQEFRTMRNPVVNTKIVSNYNLNLEVRKGRHKKEMKVISSSSSRLVILALVVTTLLLVMDNIPWISSAPVVRSGATPPKYFSTSSVVSGRNFRAHFYHEIK